MPNSFLTNKNLELILFGGKGGTGKTTCACATALYLSQKYPEKKFLVVSTDPAPSIGDSFNLEVGNKITKIKDNLWAFEMDAFQLNKEYSAKYAQAIKTLVERGTYLERSDIEEFSDKPFPGMDEIMAIMKIADFLREGKYDLIILDTAPTGHTKVLLSLPKVMAKWLKVAKLMNKKHQFLMRRIRGKYIEDEVDQFLKNTAEDINRVNALLKNYETTEFVPVTIPEPMSILETEGLVHDLEEMDISVKSIICNRLIVSDKCPFCNSRAKEKEKHLKMIEEKFSAKGGSAPGGKDYNLFKIPLFPREIRGQDSLNEYAKILFGEKPSTRAKLGAGLFPHRNEVSGAGKFEISLPKVLPKFPKIPEAKMAEFLKKDLNFIICGGKGGVGKTSLAAATAIALAKKHKDKKILITTTDPAHALSNIFNQNIPIGGGAVSIEGFNNLDALEIDAQKMQQKFNDESRQDIQEIFERFTGDGMDVAFDRKVMEELMDFSPPGLDELMALRKVIELMKEGKYNFYVLDSSASGHLLRFLETPAIVRDWLKSIFQILLKYRGVIKLDKLKVRLLDLSKDVKRVQEILSGSQTTQFLMLSIAEEMGIREMGDLAQSLEKLNVFNHYIILNMIVPASPCKFCLTKRENQEKYIAKVKKEYPKKEIVLVPLFPYDIRGIESLKNLSKFLFS